MKYILFIGYLLSTSTTFSQPIRKVKITEVEEYVKNSDHPIVLNCWATWCAPCIEEIPYFMETVKKYSDQKVELLLVSLDFASSYPNKIQEQIKKKKFNATFFWLNETNADYFCPKIDPKWDGTLPSTLFINPKTGYRKFFGRPLTDRQIELEVKKLVGLLK
ncbi:redoxin domain-containing protein [Niastella sp. OAS944]|uniref:redoxin domain-containing protein n=1 Tax=Niastella sp. OAS944 TaxID=2664089 RepID=UPI0034909CF6|nr:thiol-disulfide isomerase/thioredoxin [Chitinophagaceae bacterium OAS944]